MLYQTRETLIRPNCKLIVSSVIAFMIVFIIMLFFEQPCM